MGLIVGLLGAMAAVGLSAAGEASAKIYKWKDQDGKVHFSNMGPPPDTSKRIEVKREKAGSPPKQRGVTVSYQRMGPAIVVTAMVNRRFPARFIVDTGATYTVISKEFARRLRLRIPSETRTITLQTANGTITAPLVTVSSVSIDTAEVRDVVSAIHTIGGQGDIVGVLGLSYLNAFRVTIDGASGRLYLETKR